MPQALSEKDLLFLDAQERQIEATNNLASANEELASALKENAEAYSALCETLKEVFAPADQTGWTITDAISNLVTTNNQI